MYQRGAVDSENDSSKIITTTPPPPPRHPISSSSSSPLRARHPRLLFASSKSRHRTQVCIIPPRPANQTARHGRLCIGFARPQRAFAQQHRPCWLDLPVLLSYHHSHCAPLPTTPPVSRLSVQRHLRPSTPPSPACSAGVCIACCHESVAHSHYRCRAPLPLAEPNFPSLSPRYNTIHHHTSRSPLRHTPATRHLSCNTDSHALRHPLPPTHGVPFNRKSLLPSLPTTRHVPRADLFRSAITTFTPRRPASSPHCVPSSADACSPVISNRTISHHGVASPAGRPRSGCRLR